MKKRGGLQKQNDKDRCVIDVLAVLVLQENDQEQLTPATLMVMLSLMTMLMMMTMMTRIRWGCVDSVYAKEGIAPSPFFNASSPALAFNQIGKLFRKYKKNEH